MKELSVFSRIFLTIRIGEIDSILYGGTRLTQLETELKLKTYDVLVHDLGRARDNVDTGCSSFSGHLDLISNVSQKTNGWSQRLAVAARDSRITYNLTRRVSSHDGVVYDANRLSVKLGFDRGELSTDALLSRLLTWEWFSILIKI